MAQNGRHLTVGEIGMLRSVFGAHINYAMALVFSRRWSWPFPQDRAMAPNGNSYFPGDQYAVDFSDDRVPLGQKAVFIHEGAHLYQWYGLGRTVWLRGPFDRDYEYELVPGKAYQAYGLEEMGMIAEHFYILSQGGRLPPRYRYSLQDYAGLLPVQ